MSVVNSKLGLTLHSRKREKRADDPAPPINWDVAGGLFPNSCRTLPPPAQVCTICPPVLAYKCAQKCPQIAHRKRDCPC